MRGRRMTVLLSGRPTSVLSGVASGATLAGPDPLPSTTRIALIRARDGAAELASSNGCLPPEPAAVAANLELLGARPAGAELCSFLSAMDRSGSTQVSQAAHARLARCFDPVELPA